MKIFAPISWLFAIREPTSVLARAVLAFAFCAIIGGLWIWSTDNPVWLNRLMLAVRPAWELRAGDAVTVRVDRERACLQVTRTATGRTVERALPAIDPAQLPPLSPASYGPFFAKLASDGLGEIAAMEGGGYSARVVDAERVRDRLMELGPRPYQLQLQKGENVDIEIDYDGGKAKLSIGRIGVGGAQAAITVPPPEQREPPQLDAFPDLAAVVAQLGLTGLELHPQLGEGKHTFIAKVADPQLAQQRGLGPRNPVAPLATGTAVLLTLAGGERPVLQLALPDTGKTMTAPVTAAQLSPAAIPAADSGAYPGLAALLADLGVAAVGAAAASPGEPPAAEPLAPGERRLAPAPGPRGGYAVTDVARARASGLGLEKPVELRVLPRSTLPSPTEVFDSLPVLWGERDLPKAGGKTLLRIATGFAWATLICLPLGLLMGAFLRVGAFWDPVKLAGMYLPLPALVPLTIAWLGTSEERITLFLAISNGVVMLPFVVAAVQAVPQVYLDTARTLGATRGQMFRYCLLSVSKPGLFDAMRVSFAVGWTWIMLAETIGVTSGLGYIINTSQRRGYIEHVYVVIALVILLAFLSNVLWSLAARLLFPYVDRR